jgi:hypothetical protein
MMPLRSKVRYIVYAILVIVGVGTLYNHLTDKTADNGAACTLIGLVLLFFLELGYAIAERRARMRS